MCCESCENPVRMSFLLSLPEDLLCHLLSYSHFIDLMICHRLCVDMKLYLQHHPILYRRLLRHIYFPNYEPFQSSLFTPLEEKKILLKWFKQEYKWSPIGQLNPSYGRYLHRAVPYSLSNGTHGMITYGGVTQHGYCSCDLWSFSLTQQILSFQPILPSDSNPSHFHTLHEPSSLPINLNPHTPPNNSAFALCGGGNSSSSSSDYIYLYGGRILQWTPHHHLESGFTDGLWQYHRPTNQWTNLHNSFLINIDSHTSSIPPASWGHTTVMFEDHLFLFGGSSVGMTYNDLWMIDLRHIRSELQKRKEMEEEVESASHQGMKTAGGGRRTGGAHPPPRAQFISDHWKLVPLPAENRPTARGGHAAVLMVLSLLFPLLV
jgi:hypothetical protein